MIEKPEDEQHEVDDDFVYRRVTNKVYDDDYYRLKKEYRTEQLKIEFDNRNIEGQIAYSITELERSFNETDNLIADCGSKTLNQLVQINKDIRMLHNSCVEIGSNRVELNNAVKELANINFKLWVIVFVFIFLPIIKDLMNDLF